MDTKKTEAEKARKIDTDHFDLDEFRNSFINRRRMVIKNTLKKRLRLVTIFLFISVAAAAFFAVRTALYYIELTRNRSIQEKAAEIAGSQAPVSVRPEQTVDPENIPKPAETAEPEETPVEKPVLDKIKELRREFSNDDIVGYLTIGETNINYTVVQYTDNEFYLSHDLYGSNNSAGSIFMDYENSMSVFDDNTVIYGHNMPNGSMFHNLQYYADKQFYESHPLVRLTTPYEETVWEVFAFYSTDADFYYLQTDFGDRKQFGEFIAQIMEKSMYDTGVSVGVNDKILTLSTCSGKSYDKRYVLNAKLLTN